MDTDQRRNAPQVKTHEEILSLLRELDILEDRVKNLQLTQDDLYDGDLILQEVERIESIIAPQSDVPTETVRQETPQKKQLLSLLEHHRIQQAGTKKMRRRPFSDNKHFTLQVPETGTPRHLWKRKTTTKPTPSTFKLYITEEGSLAGLDMQRPKPPKPQLNLLRRHHKTETGEQLSEAQGSGFPGKIKHVVSRIIPRRSKTKESSAGIGSRLKGIVKRRPKEQK